MWYTSQKARNIGVFKPSRSKRFRGLKLRAVVRISFIEILVQTYGDSNYTSHEHGRLKVRVRTPSEKRWRHCHVPSPDYSNFLARYVANFTTDVKSVFLKNHEIASALQRVGVTTRFV